mgnify:CR=1 FL=1
MSQRQNPQHHRIASDDSFKESILEFVRSKRNVSFVEISELKGARGEVAIELGASNVFVWTGLSKAAADAVMELRREGKIKFSPTHILTYLCDGATLRMPQVKSARAVQRGYKSPHWLPVVLDAVGESAGRSA